MGFKDGKKAHFSKPLQNGLLKMERRPISVNLHKIKINDIKTVIFFSTFKVIYINADNNIIIPLKACHIEIRALLNKLWAFKDRKEAHFCKPSQN